MTLCNGLILLKQHLLDAGHMDKKAADQLLTQEELTYCDICHKAKHVYRSLVDNGKWPPAFSAVDSKTPSSKFGRAHMNNLPFD